MCFGSKQKTETPAAAPAAPLPAPKAPLVGETRRDENIAAFGQDTPTYRVTRKKDTAASRKVSENRKADGFQVPDRQIKM